MKIIDFLANDKVQLNGILYQNEKESKKVILSVHGMSSNCFKKRDSAISKVANENGIDYFCFNNRGSELVKYIIKDKEKVLAGTTYEDVAEGYEDILGAINKLEKLGYQEIYLQGHSLGSTKIVYTYNKLKKENHILLNKIKGIILLSLVDIPNVLKVYLAGNYNSYLKMAEEKERAGKVLEIMPKEAFIYPISVKTFLRYARDYQIIDFANYSKDSKLEVLNNISIPLMMRWGNDKEMIAQKAKDLVEIIKKTIINPRKDIDYIDGANHSYTGKEEILAKQIINFIKKI